MGLFKKKADPIHDRARALSAEIAAVEASIKKLQKNPAPPRAASPPGPVSARPDAGAPRAEPIFEPVNQKRIRSVQERVAAPGKKELGVRTGSWSELWRRVRKQFHAPATENPRLVNYLAAGSIQGLRPLRYEKRIARNRFLFFMALLVAVVIGLCYFFRHTR